MGDIARRIVQHASQHPEIVSKALERLASDFRDAGHVGPQRAAAFDTLSIDDVDAAAADAHGHVDDLLRACRRQGLGVLPS